VFDVQSFSLHDGPGIRTTVFLKGCPLNCGWCHNPEAMSPQPQLMYNAAACVGDGACVAACPNEVHSLLDGRHVVDFARCLGCGECTKVCCYGALRLVGESFTPAGLLQRCRPDRVYWGADGGVTFSGGEPLRQAAFVREFADLAPEVHLAVDTCAYAPRDRIVRLVDVVDLWLVDFKATDPATHRELTGAGNRLILDNLDYLCQHGREVWLRLPLIPGVNDDDAHLQGIAAVLQAHPQIAKAEIMAYHNLGAGKRARLGLPGQRVTTVPPSDEQKRAWLDRFAALGADHITISS
jgi:pyruvate formate lyase activating enzyme